MPPAGASGSMADRKKVNVIIVGGGTAGWMTAAALAKLLPDALPRSTSSNRRRSASSASARRRFPTSAPSTSGSASTRPTSWRAPGPRSSWASSSANWGRIGDRYIHPFGTFGRGQGEVDFHQYWLRAAAGGRGRSPSSSEYSLACMMARLNKFDLPSTDPARLDSTFGYAYQFDATLFAPYLRALRRAARRAAHRGPDRRRRPRRRERRRRSDPAGERRADRRRPVRRLLGLRLAADRQGAGRAVRGLVAMAALRPRRGDAVPDRDRAHALYRRRSRWSRAGAGASRCSTAPATAMSILERFISRRRGRAKRWSARSRASRSPSRGCCVQGRAARAQLGRTIASRSGSRAASSSRWNRPAST